jgi:hypothetical protein
MIKKCLLFFMMIGFGTSAFGVSEVVPLEQHILPELVTQADFNPYQTTSFKDKKVIIFVHGYSATIKESQIIWENLKPTFKSENTIPIFVNVYDLKLDGKHVERYKAATPSEMRNKVLAVYNEVLKRGVSPKNITVFGISFGGALSLDLTLDNKFLPATKVIVHDPYVFDRSILNQCIGWWVGCKGVGPLIRNALSHVSHKQGDVKNKLDSKRLFWFDYFYVPAILDVLAFSSKVSGRLKDLHHGTASFHNPVLFVLSEKDTYGDSLMTLDMVAGKAEVILVPSPVHVTLQDKFHNEHVPAKRMAAFVGAGL